MYVFMYIPHISPFSGVKLAGDWFMHACVFVQQYVCVCIVHMHTYIQYSTISVASVMGCPTSSLSLPLCHEQWLLQDAAWKA